MKVQYLYIVSLLYIYLFTISVSIETKQMKEIAIENLTSLLKAKEGIYYNYHKPIL